ncbi:MAG: patatin-like phospholipase family protein, partial [FCB group bacterium]|nr:patatin-like phospholipase family protein [FCB group bacterium]
MVLSGGGAQGLAHIGVLKALEERQIPIDLIVGTSAGALVGGLYSSGIMVEQLETMANDGTIMELFLGRNELGDIPVWQRNDKSYGNFSFRRSDGRISGPPGLLNDQLIWRDLFLLTAPANYLAQSDFDSLFIPFRAIGADMVKQVPVVLDSGSLAEALRISMSIPMIYPAIMKDGTIFMDGGIYNTMPTDVARDLGADYVIAVNVDDVPPSVENMNDIFDVFDFFSGVMFSFSDSSNVTGWDYFINVDTRGYNLFNFAEGQALIERGYQAGLEAADRIVGKMNRKRDMEEVSVRQQQVQTALDNVSIQSIQWENLKTGQLISGMYEIDVPFNYSTRKISSIINALYATNVYDLIIPMLVDNDHTLKFIIRHKAKMQMIPEVKINSVDGFNLSGDWDYRFSDRRYSLRSKVGIGNTRGSMEFILSPNKFIHPQAVDRSHLIWKLNIFGNYQDYQHFTSIKYLYLYRIGAGFSPHLLLSWDQQIVATANIHANRWVNLDQDLGLDYGKILFPELKLRYELNHLRRNTPHTDGWTFQMGVTTGIWKSTSFYNLEGLVKMGFPLTGKYHFGMVAHYQSTSDPAPLEYTLMRALPLAFTRSHAIENLAYTSYGITMDLSRTLFRDDLFLVVRSYNTYLENQIFGEPDGWTIGGDVSIKYNSILGPLELGWSIFPD